jgi:hypothetical protein
METKNRRMKALVDLIILMIIFYGMQYSDSSKAEIVPSPK